MSDKSYEQPGDYIPRNDEGFRSFLVNFSNLISENPAMYGLGQSDADIIAGHKQAYSELFELCQSAKTRTSGVIAQKDAARASAVAACRLYGQMIKGSPAVDNQAKIELGLRVDATRTPIPAPESAPVLTLKGVKSGEHVLTYADENTPESKAKPPGASNIEIYRYVGAQATADPEQATFVGAFSRNPIKQSFSAAEANRTVTYFARWRTARGLVGPWSAPIAMGIAVAGATQPQSFTPESPDGGQPMSTDTAGGDDMKIAA